MKYYYIGMHNKFDEVKFKKDFTKHIDGIELCNFDDLSDVQKILKLSKENNFKIGIHFPLLKSSYKYRDPQVTSIDKDESSEAFDSIINELEIAKDINAEYLLIHFPKPMILNDNLDWSILNFQVYEGVFESTLDKTTFINECDKAMKRLNALSEQYNIPIVLEMEFINKWFYDESWFVTLLQKYSRLSICLDFSRIHLQNYIDGNFDDCSFISKLSPYTSALHVANLQVDGTVLKRHYPAFPHLSKNDGWGDMSKLISSLSESRELKNVLFEHRTDGIDTDEVVSCYEWISGLINNL